ncbi:MAG: histidine phosphatase family protein [Mycobacteriales bacterium]
MRHGQTAWSALGKHTGRTDIPLTGEGAADAGALAVRLAGLQPALVLSSPLRRARETAERVGYPSPEVLADLSEWHYGDYEGLTTTEIRLGRPDWSLWRDGVPGGESPADVAVRADRVVARLQATPGVTLVFAHGHLLRVLAARWLGLSTEAGRLFALSAGSLSVLGWERELPVLRLWNDVAHLSPAPVVE